MLLQVSVMVGNLSSVLWPILWSTSHCSRRL